MSRISLPFTERITLNLIVVSQTRTVASTSQVGQVEAALSELEIPDEIDDGRVAVVIESHRWFGKGLQFTVRMGDGSLVQGGWALVKNLVVLDTYLARFGVDDARELPKKSN